MKPTLADPNRQWHSSIHGQTLKARFMVGKSLLFFLFVGGADALPLPRKATTPKHLVRKRLMEAN